MPAYLGTLLAAFPGKEQGRHRTGLIEPLSGRELEVLRLLAAGGSNAELAAKLFVEQSTVKTTSTTRWASPPDPGGRPRPHAPAAGLTRPQVPPYAPPSGGRAPPATPSG